MLRNHRLITGETYQAGDVLIGLASSGIHSNGYSLVRKIFLEDQELDLQDVVPELGRKLGRRIIKTNENLCKIRSSCFKKFEVNGMAHITGGGFIENIPRMLPEGLGAEIELGAGKFRLYFNSLKKKVKLRKRRNV